MHIFISHIEKLKNTTEHEILTELQKLKKQYQKEIPFELQAKILAFEFWEDQQDYSFYFGPYAIFEKEGQVTEIPSPQQITKEILE